MPLSDSGEQDRKQLMTPRKRILLWAMFVSAMLAGYLFSEAPLKKFEGSGSVELSNAYRHSKTFLYQPADWMFNNTPLQTLLLKWARFWNVEDELFMDHVFRNEARLGGGAAVPN